MPKAKKGDTVKLHYTGYFEDGSAFDTTDGQAPVEFVIGSEDVIPGIDNAVIGMSPGETKSIEVSADDAYGPYNKNLAIKITKDELPEGFEPEVGQQFELDQPDDKVYLVTIIDIKDDEIVLDANHPLAGHDLRFDLELIDIA